MTHDWIERLPLYNTLIQGCSSLSVGRSAISSLISSLLDLYSISSMKQKVVIKVQVHCEKCRTKAMEVAAKEGVESVTLQGKDKNEIVVVGEDVDSACLTTRLRKKVGYANILTIEEVDEEKILKEKLEKKKKEEDEKKMKEAKEQKIKEQEEKEKKEFERYKEIKKRCFLGSLNLDCDCKDCAKPCVQIVPHCPVPPPPPYIPQPMMVCRFDDDPCSNSCTIM